MSSRDSRRSFLRILATGPVVLAGCSSPAPVAPAAACPTDPSPHDPRVAADLFFHRMREVTLGRDVAPAFSFRLPRSTRRR
jgi:hypothetical protein